MHWHGGVPYMWTLYITLNTEPIRSSKCLMDWIGKKYRKEINSNRIMSETTAENNNNNNNKTLKQMKKTEKNNNEEIIYKRYVLCIHSKQNKTGEEKQNIMRRVENKGPICVIVIIFIYMTLLLHNKSTKWILTYRWLQSFSSLFSCWCCSWNVNSILSHENRIREWRGGGPKHWTIQDMNSRFQLNKYNLCINPANAYKVHCSFCNARASTK